MLLSRIDKREFRKHLYSMRSIRREIKDGLEATKDYQCSYRAKHLYLMYANLVDVDSAIVYTIEHLKKYGRKNVFHDIDIMKMMTKTYKAIDRRNKIMYEDLLL